MTFPTFKQNIRNYIYNLTDFNFDITLACASTQKS